MIVLPEGGTEPIADLGQEGPPEEWDWDDLCRSLVARSIGGGSPGTETFLCLLGDELVVRRDREELSRLLRSISEHTWGSRLFLVANEGILPSPDLVRERASLADWFATALSGRVLDLLQVAYDRWAKVSAQALRDACSRAGLRQRFLGDRARERRWRCLVPLEKQGLSFHLLTPYLLGRGPSRLDIDLLIVVPYTDPERQVQWVEEARRRHPDPACYVVTLAASSGQVSEMGPGISPELAACCERQGLGEPVALNGFLELWYFLLRLNAMQAPAEAGIQGVALDERPLLAMDGNRQLHVLMSSSFYLDEEVHLQEAAYDVGALLALAPLELSYRVEPALTREKLIKIAEAQPPPTVWIHMGHGQPEGLKEFGFAGDFVSAADWLGCIAGRELKLVLFLTCDSDHVAERFARAGAGIAIGFTAGVETDKPRQVALAVFRAMMSHGAQREAILAACERGAHHFTALHEPPCEVRAYYPLP